MDDDEVSVTQVAGYYEEEEEGEGRQRHRRRRWLGCVCGAVHPRPRPVFWIQCDGLFCERAWYNVSPECVGFRCCSGGDGGDADEKDVEANGKKRANRGQLPPPPSSWYCRECSKRGFGCDSICEFDCGNDDDDNGNASNSNNSNNNRVLERFVALPVPLLYRILDYVVCSSCNSSSSSKAYVLCRQLSLVCWRLRYAVQHYEPWNELWNLILRQDYCCYRPSPPIDERSASITTTTTMSSPPPQKRSRRTRRLPLVISSGYYLSSELLQRQYGEKEDGTDTATDSSSALRKVRDVHVATCNATDDVHVAVATMAASKDEPLSKRRLRSAIVSCASSSFSASLSTPPPSRRIFANRRSPYTGRTLLHAVVASDYGSESVILGCVRELCEQYGADPNVRTNAEHPFADRPVLYFAISRAMPSLVEYLIERCRMMSRTDSIEALLGVCVSGKFPSACSSHHTFEGTFNPLQFARRLRQEEYTIRAARSSVGTESWRTFDRNPGNPDERSTTTTPTASADHSAVEGTGRRMTQQRRQQPVAAVGLPPYWMRKLDQCIDILSKASMGAK